MSALDTAKAMLDKTKGRKKGSFDIPWSMGVSAFYWEAFKEALLYEAEVRHIDISIDYLPDESRTRVSFKYQNVSKEPMTAVEAYRLYRQGKITRAEWSKIMMKESLF
jgi:hypothetical protein